MGYTCKEGLPLLTMQSDAWKTKPTDRFVLKFIKVHICAHISPLASRSKWLRPWMVTLASAFLGAGAGILFAIGKGFLAGCTAAVAQVLDGVDGQLARLKNLGGPQGAFWDSVLDRYADGALVTGLILYCLQHPGPIPSWVILVAGALAFIGSGQISYTTARGESLGLDMGPPTLASKGTRTTVVILGAWGSALWEETALISLAYLVFHPNVVVVRRLARAWKADAKASPKGMNDGGTMKAALGVVHGRFQVLHNDHLAYILAALERCHHLIIGITNPDPNYTREDAADQKRALPTNNPLTYFERYTMIRLAMRERGIPEEVFSVVPFPINLPQLILNYTPKDATYFLTIYDDWGRRKLELLRALGLSVSVLWERDQRHKGITASQVRDRIVAGRPWRHLVPPSTAKLVDDWNLRERLITLSDGIPARDAD